MRIKWYRIALAVIAFTAMLTLVISVNGSNHAEQKIKKYLLDQNVSYTSVEFTDNVLRMDFSSYGVDYCTVDDVRAINAVYEMVQYYDFLQNCDGCEINIKDVNEKLVYNIMLYEIGRDKERVIHNTETDILSAERELLQIFSSYGMQFGSFEPVSLYDSDEQYKISAKILCSEDGLLRLLGEVDLAALNHTIEEIMLQYAGGMIFEGEFICGDQTKMLVHSDYKMSFLNTWIDQSIKEVFIRSNGPLQ